MTDRFDGGDESRVQALMAENERLRGTIARAYDVAMEMSHDDHQALVCVLELLEHGDA